MQLRFTKSSLNALTMLVGIGHQTMTSIGHWMIGHTPTCKVPIEDLEPWSRDVKRSNPLLFLSAYLGIDIQEWKH